MGIYMFRTLKTINITYNIYLPRFNPTPGGQGQNGPRGGQNHKINNNSTYMPIGSLKIV